MQKHSWFPVFILAHNETFIADTDMSPNAYINVKYRPYRYICWALV